MKKHSYMGLWILILFILVGFCYSHDDLVLKRSSEHPRGVSLAGEGARYLIVVPDALYDAILPLAEWKHQKGMQCKIARLSETGSSSAQIKNYVQNAYLNWEVPPEYLLIAAGFGYIPYGTEGSVSTDNYYTNFDGDIFNEIIPGRLPADNLIQLQTMVSKILNYEKTPYMADTLWYLKGLTMVREDDDPLDDALYWSDADLAAAFWDDEGYLVIDQLSRYTDDSDDLLYAINDGRAFVTYRGQAVGNWWWPFELDPYGLDNGYMLPVVVSPSCHMALSYDISHDWLRAGTPTNPKGGIAFCATTTTLGGGANLRSALFKGFFRTLYEDNLFTFGACVEGGRQLVYLEPDSRNQQEYRGFSAIGDPELNIWTHVPHSLTVEHLPVAPFGHSEFEVNVRYHGEPVPDALVCVMMDTVLYEYGYTDSSGEVSLSISISRIDSMLITVTSPNCIPYQAKIAVFAEGAYVVYCDYTFSDSIGGNNDGYINPGELIYLQPVVRNFGMDIAEEVNVIVSSLDSRTTIFDSLCFFGNIPYMEPVGSSCFYTVFVHSGIPNGEHFQLSLEAYDTIGNRWISNLPPLAVVTAVLEFFSYVVNDLPPRGNGNGLVDPGEEVFFVLRLYNSGLSGLDAVEGILRSLNPYVEVADSEVLFGEAPGETYCSNDEHPFLLYINPSTPAGSEAQFIFMVTGEGGAYNYQDTLFFELQIRPLAGTDPSGPDAYGYWAYDNTDTEFSPAPEYNWFEIGDYTSPGEIISEITNEDADTVNLELPFDFRYYGNSFHSIGICSNGFLELNRSTHRFGTPYPIPTNSSPQNLLAPFWDDLDPSSDGDIYQYYDTLNHRWIMEFKNVTHWADTRRETFQVILYDPVYYPTPTGDGEIVFLYNSVGVVDGACIGIENLTGTDGLQYFFDDEYIPGGAPVTNERAIKFTTIPPNISDAPWIHYNTCTIDDFRAGNNNGIAENGEEVDLIVGLINSGTHQALDTRTKLCSPFYGIRVQDSLVNYGDLEVDSMRFNFSHPYVVIIDSLLSADTVIHLPLYIYANDSTYVNVSYIPFQVISTTGIDDKLLPVKFRVYSNYPNPFNASTNVKVQLPLTPGQQPEFMELHIYSIDGKIVRSVFEKIDILPVLMEINWDGKDQGGSSVSSGIYLYKIRFGSFCESHKMLLLR